MMEGSIQLVCHSSGTPYMFIVLKAGCCLHPPRDSILCTFPQSSGHCARRDEKTHAGSSHGPATSSFVGWSTCLCLNHHVEFSSRMIAQDEAIRHSRVVRCCATSSCHFTGGPFDCTTLAGEEHIDRSCSDDSSNGIDMPHNRTQQEQLRPSRMQDTQTRFCNSPSVQWSKRSTFRDVRPISLLNKR